VPVCGSKELTAQPYAIWPPPPDAVYGPPYEDHLGEPSYEVCPNCGFDFIAHHAATLPFAIVESLFAAARKRLPPPVNES